VTPDLKSENRLFLEEIIGTSTVEGINDIPRGTVNKKEDSFWKKLSPKVKEKSRERVFPTQNGSMSTLLDDSLS
jgi:hypothetical protein